jgi:hypothetical protein
MKPVQELKCRLIGSALETLGTAIWLDEDATIHPDVVALHHMLSREYRAQLHVLRGLAQAANSIGHRGTHE